MPKIDQDSPQIFKPKGKKIQFNKTEKIIQKSKDEMSIKSPQKSPTLNKNGANFSSTQIIHGLKDLSKTEKYTKLNLSSNSAQIQNQIQIQIPIQIPLKLSKFGGKTGKEDSECKEIKKTEKTEKSEKFEKNEKEGSEVFSPEKPCVFNKSSSDFITSTVKKDYNFNMHGVIKQRNSLFDTASDEDSLIADEFKDDEEHISTDLETRDKLMYKHINFLSHTPKINTSIHFFKDLLPCFSGQIEEIRGNR
jgi:hypothetical protein